MQLLQSPTNTSGKQRAKATILTVAMIVAALLSVVLVAPITSSPDTYKDAYVKLEEKRDNVISLAAAATAASFTISTLGLDDAGTPIADKLMVIAKDFSLVLAAIVLEKYLMTIMGAVTFSGIVPLCCLIFAATAFMDSDNAKRQALRTGCLKLFLLGLVFYFAIPVSVSIASMIDDTYQSSIDAVNEQASVFNATTETVVEEEVSATKSGGAKDDEENGGLLEQLSRFGDGVVDTVSSAVNGAAGTVLGVVNAARDMVGDLIELFGVMIATSIIIPILVPAVMYLALKLFFGQQFTQAASKVVFVTTDGEKVAATPLPAATVEASEIVRGEQEA